MPALLFFLLFFPGGVAIAGPGAPLEVQAVANGGSAVLPPGEPGDGASSLTATDVDSVFDAIRADRARGRYPSALEKAKDLLGSIGPDSSIARHRREDAAREVATIERILGFPAGDRQEMAQADSLAATLDSLRNEGKYDDALAGSRKVAASYERLLGPEDPEYAAALDGVGLSLTYTNELPEAETVLRADVELCRRVFGERHPEYAAALANLAQCLQSEGFLRESEPMIREAARLARDLLGPDDPQYAGYLANLGSVLLSLGEYEAAEPTYREVVARMRALEGGETETVALVTFNLGFLLLRKGDRPEGEAMIREALRIQEVVQPGDHPNTALYLLGLADALRRRSDFEGAHRAASEALAMQKRLLGEEDLDLAEAWSSLGLIERESGDLESAENSYRAALTITRSALREDHPRVARRLFELALVYKDRGRFAAADSCLRAGLSVQEKVLGNSHPYTVQTLRELGAVRLGAGDPAGADSFLDRAAEAFEVSRLHAGTGLERATFQDSPYRLLAGVRLLEGRREEAWEAVERELGRSLADLLLSTGQRHLGPEESARLDSLSVAVLTLEDRFRSAQREAERDGSESIRRTADDLQNRLLATQARYTAFRRELSERHPVAEGETYSLAQVQHALERDTAILGWLDLAIRPGESRSWGYVIRDHGPVFWAQLPAPSDPGKAARDFLDEVRRGGSIASVRRAGAALYAERIAPLDAALQGVADLVVIPSGPMLGVPAEAMLQPDGSYLSDRYAVSYAPSSTVYAWLTGLDRRRVDGNVPAVLLGDPAFTAAHEREMAAEAEAPEKARETGGRNEGPQTGAGSGRNESDRPHISLAVLPDSILLRAAEGGLQSLSAIPRLPGTRDEIRAIAPLFPDATVFLGPDASEQNLVRLAQTGSLSGYRVLHFATHAVADDQDPKRSALILSGAEPASRESRAFSQERIYDGLLSAREILAEWKLDADLVTLSACETGLGTRIGGEGYIGLAHAFLQNGARSLLVSLWKVDDTATMLLMRRFYENLTGRHPDRNETTAPMEKTHALNEARSWLRTYSEGGIQPYAHPSFWSPFILVGDRR